MADAYWGRYWTIAVYSSIYFIGMCTLTLSASIPSSKPVECVDAICPSATPSQYAVFFVGLYLIALGTGGNIKPCVSSFGADEFDDTGALIKLLWSCLLKKELEAMYSNTDRRTQNLDEGVLGDGHCGFRTIAVCLGYGEDEWAMFRTLLTNELRNQQGLYTRVFRGGGSFEELHQSLCFSGSGPASQPNWMIMPDTGVLIANLFGVIVHCLSNQGSTTCFPLLKGPQEFQNHESIIIAYVHGNHYVMVRLQGHYPMPPITPLCPPRRYPCIA